MVALEAAYVGRLMQNLGPAAREHVVAMIEGLSNHSLLLRLIGDDGGALNNIENQSFCHYCEKFRV